MACSGCKEDAVEIYKGILPATYCDRCNILVIDGKEIHIPSAVKEKVVPVLEAAGAMASETATRLIGNPHERIENYFKNVFTTAFAEGFHRAYALLKVKKEGRMKRIRQLWDKGELDEYKVVFMMKDIQDIKELDRLIRWK